MVKASTLQWLVNSNDLLFLPFSTNHIERLNLGDVDVDLLEAQLNPQERLLSVEGRDCAWTAYYQGQPAMSFGFDYKWPGVIEVWMLPGKLAIEHGTILTRAARRLFVKLGPHLNLRRLQIVVDVNREKAVEWADFLGFKREGVMKRYGPEGHDYYMYARIYK